MERRGARVRRGSARPADKWEVEHSRSPAYRSWLVGELLVVGLLASATALFASRESLQSAYVAPEARLALDSTVAVVAIIVAVLATAALASLAKNRLDEGASA